MSKKHDDRYDVIVIGDDAAAAVAAACAARLKARTLLLDAGGAPRAGTKLDWLGPLGVAFCKDHGIQPKKIDAAEFKECRLHSWDLRRDSLVKDKDLFGWIVERAALRDELVRLAVQRGVERLSADGPAGITLADDRVVLRFADRPDVVGRLLLITGEADNPIVPLTKLVPAGRTRDMADGLFLEYETDEPATRLDVAIGANRAGQIALVLRRGKQVGLRLVARGLDEPIERQFAAFRKLALETGLLPPGAPEQPGRRPSPGGAALDMDTHVGKRCLLFGAAGGFVSAFSHEESYPTMRSGVLAAETAVEALAASLPQDRLAGYGAVWRGELADYLRMPNTDFSLLAPLVFNNEQMSRRVAKAFLLGQPF